MALCVCMHVTGVNEVGGTMSTHEILASEYDIAKVKQKHSKTAMLVLLYIFLLLRLKHNM